MGAGGGGAGIPGVTQPVAGGCSGQCHLRLVCSLPCSATPTGSLPQSRLCLEHAEKRKVGLASSQGEAASSGVTTWRDRMTGQLARNPPRSQLVSKGTRPMGKKVAVKRTI